MPPFCPFGAEPQPTAPPFFTFDETAVSTLFPPLAGMIALAQLDIPTQVQVTADFCAAGPPEDLPTVGDLLMLGTGVLGIASGAWHRVGNQVKANKWAEMCQCKVAPPGPSPAVSAGPWVHWGVLNITGQEAPPRVQDVLPRGPRGKLWRVRMAADTVPLYEGADPRRSYALAKRVTGDAPLVGQLASDLWPGTPETGTIWLDPAVVPWQTEFSNQTSQGSGPENDWDQRTSPTLDGPIFYGFGRDYPDTPHDWAAALHIEYYETVPPLYTPPEPPEFPDDYPTSGGICDVVSLGDLCRTLIAMNAKLDYLAKNVNPPQVIPDDEPLNGPGPFEKPPLAVGVVVEVTAIPAWQAHHGADPAFWPALGHVGLVTPYGPLPSILIKHNPLVVLPIPAQVTHLSLDLAPGVRAQVRFLNAPK